MVQTETLTKTWTVQAVEDLTVDLLADLLGRNAQELAGELRARSARMPVDSLDMLDILQELRDRTGLKLPVREIKRDTMRSVRAFAEFAVGSGNA